MDTSSLLAKHDRLWRGASEHRFVLEVGDGSLPEEAFAAWLAQDYLFVLGLLGYQARLVPEAPRRDQALMVGGLVALEAELSWFEQKADRRSLSLDARTHPDNAAYGEFLAGLENEAYAVNAVALWAVEQAYLDAWTNAAPGAERYREFVEHWTTPDFEAYVVGLREAADAALAASPGDHDRPEKAFTGVARLERGFWGLAYAGVGS